MPHSTLSYESATSNFNWEIPEHYNIGFDVCDRWAHIQPNRLALIHELYDGSCERYTFEDLRVLSNKTANCLRERGVKIEDRVAILLAQSPQTATVHIAIYKSGAIAVPLFSLFGEEALEFRLRDSGACVLITDREGAKKIEPIRKRLPSLRHILVTDSTQTHIDGYEDMQEAMASCSEEFIPVKTRANDPALIIYTSGTTGKPKGALHAQRTLLGHLPGVEMSHGGSISADSIFWTPADWAWIGGLLDVLLPALHHGVPVVAHRFQKFDAIAALNLMSKHKVTNVFLPPTAIKMLRSEKEPSKRWNLDLRTVASGGESLGEELLGWVQNELGAEINEFYGQTECNMVVSSCSKWFKTQPRAIGRCVPGHEVKVLNEKGQVVPYGQIGQIGVKQPDPVMFLGYWNNQNATDEKYINDYLMTGDTGQMDEDGFIYFVGRNDDVITSAGYRIGPGPIEDCLIGHPAVRQVAVVGIPDKDRTEIVKAFVVLADGFTPSKTLTTELQNHVRNRLAAHEYPREIEYLNDLPMTTTGKVIRRELRDR